MNALSESLGMFLMGSNTIPTVLTARMTRGGEIGEEVVELVQRGITTKNILTGHTFENAVMYLLIMGGSINGILHPRATYYRAGPGELPRFSYTDNRDVLETAEERFTPTRGAT